MRVLALHRYDLLVKGESVTLASDLQNTPMTARIPPISNDVARQMVRFFLQDSEQ